MINVYTLGKLYGQAYRAKDTGGVKKGYEQRKKMIRTEKDNNDTNSHPELTIRTKKENDTNSHAELTILPEKENDTNSHGELKVRTVESSSPGMTVGRGWGSSVVIAD